jgi:hypothetical protein
MFEGSSELLLILPCRQIAPTLESFRQPNTITIQVLTKTKRKPRIPAAIVFFLSGI